MRARAYVYIDGAIIEGYFLNSSLPQDAGAINLVHFSTSMLVTNYVDTTSFYVPQGNIYEYPQGAAENIPWKKDASGLSKAKAKVEATKKFKNKFKVLAKKKDGLPSLSELKEGEIGAVVEGMLSRFHGPEVQNYIAAGKGRYKQGQGLYDKAHGLL